MAVCSLPDLVPQDVASHTSEVSSRSSAPSSGAGSSMGAIILMALAHLQLDIPQAQPVIRPWMLPVITPEPLEAPRSWGQSSAVFPSSSSVTAQYTLSGGHFGCRCHEGLSITLVRGRHPPPPSGSWLRYIQFMRLLVKLTTAATVVSLGLLMLHPLQKGLNSFHPSGTSTGNSRCYCVASLLWLHGGRDHFSFKACT